MRRRLFTLCSAVSLVLCLALLTLLVRSYWWQDDLTHYRFSGPVMFQGEMHDHFGLDFRVWVKKGRFAGMYRGEATGFYYPGVGSKSAWDLTMYRARGAGSTDPLGLYRARGAWWLVFYLWMPVVPFGILPSFWLRSSMRSRRGRLRRQAGLCHSCGYDIRATPARCPECGAADTMRASP